MLAKEPASDQNVLDHSTVDVSETLFAPLVEVGEPFVIQAHQVQDRGMDVVNMGAVDDRFETEFVSLAVADAAFDSRAGERPTRIVVDIDIRAG